jgi:hypothetical protein
MSEKEGPGFKIVDRRSFDAQGNPREGEGAAEGEPQARPAEPVAREAPPPRPSAASGAGPGPSGYYVGESTEEMGPLDFPQFILSVAQLGFAFLGDIPSPQSGRRERNVAAARQQIDLLVLLREKTKGNLTQEEGQLLAALLYELQMRFVEVMGEQRPKKSGA